MNTSTPEATKSCSAEKLDHDLIMAVGGLQDEELIFLLSALYGVKSEKLQAQAAELLGYYRVSEILNSFARIREACGSVSDSKDRNYAIYFDTASRLIRLVEAHTVQILKKKQVVV